MAKEPSSVEEKLRLLGEHFRASAARAHPPSAKTMAAVNDIVGEQWEREQQVNQMLSQSDPAKGQNPAQEQSQAPGHQAEPDKGLSKEKTTGQGRSASQGNSKSTGQSQDHDSDHDHGHDHGH